MSLGGNLFPSTRIFGTSILLGYIKTNRELEIYLIYWRASNFFEINFFDENCFLAYAVDHMKIGNRICVCILQKIN
jgi:hypothetical protein